ncbi:5,10-methylene-tetrahydrofolate dehydrogenase/methenyl tetrahydrofolate cyclohydrolase [Sphaerochaeta pleomorpha str. Grapes]|uniref:Bifunctional protein FolD n=1 Tax=Sphaerochaeta pleomorpha (strain ATCC BAA-1885 / DSM 22778 / Grapes) TaxID=158190 RepID=G8QVJ5_SPHPG|nr:bifunctional methylenetetrahydrofolate dehydrogenase/methenyltetrahydrofolate cyclohydrolase FolD [Sphaerochaeta pleomorpha]AEV28228.1 5,10-methylene-tetrahydrofolate dehydrogenase/methenyl tetrahydrofolate cyclohydrolase [Sphaerochaeta pleomorpha str. Grapes]
MQLLTGKEVSDAVFEDLEKQTSQFIAKHGFAPTLAVILVGNDPASQSYVKSKKKACISLGFGHRDYELAEDTTQEVLLDLVKELNADATVHGILVQLPLPKGLDENLIIESIDSKKDVDGFHPINVGKLLIGLPCFVSCTPKGVLEMLDFYHIETKGKHAVIIGRSNIVGKPMAALLIQKGRDATVTICHSKTENLKEIVNTADIIIAAMGKPLFITPDMVKKGAIIIDVGINRVEDPTRKRGYRLVGDVDFEQVKDICSAITPVPGGVGVMTIAMLMKNTLQAAIQLAHEDTK